MLNRSEKFVLDEMHVFAMCLSCFFPKQELAEIGQPFPSSRHGKHQLAWPFGLEYLGDFTG